MKLVDGMPLAYEQYRIQRPFSWQAAERVLWGRVYDNMLAAVRGEGELNRDLNIRWLEVRSERLRLEHKPVESQEAIEWARHIKGERE